MQIVLGSVLSDPRVLDKRSDFSSHTQLPLTVDIFKNCDIRKPEFLLQSSVISGKYNYCYVPNWQSYYFINEPIVLDGNRCTISGELDYLTTYADSIKNLHGYLIRTADENFRNKYLRDTIQPKQTNRYLQTLQFDKSPFTANYTTDICYVLTVVGGVQRV